MFFVRFVDRKTEKSVYFSKIGDFIEDVIGPNDFFNLQFYLDRSVYIKFNISANNKASNIGKFIFSLSFAKNL